MMRFGRLNWILALARKAPDVTVIIPVYNKRKYLSACLESVLNQTGVKLEVICVDDCSSDGSWEIAAEVARTEPLLRLVRNHANIGAAQSRNIGISLARGRYIQFTDADDLLPRGSLTALLEAAERTGSDVARGTLQVLRGGVSTAWPTETITEEKVRTFLDLPELWIPWFHCCFLISRALLTRENTQYPLLVAGEDAVFMASILTKAHRICVTPRVTYTYRQDDERTPPTLRTVQDYIAHAKLVKQIYAGAHDRCWAAYGKFIKGDIGLLMNQAQLNPEECQVLSSQVDEL